MGLKGKLIAEFEIRSSADQFHHQLRHKPHHISTFSDVVQGCELHGGEFGSDGSTICWRYTQLDGKVCSATEKVQFDEETKTIILKVIEGEVLEDYKEIVVKLQAIPRQGDTDLVRWTLEYEKLREDVPHPVKSLDVLVNMSKHMEAHHLKAAA